MRAGKVAIPHASCETWVEEPLGRGAEAVRCLADGASSGPVERRAWRRDGGLVEAAAVAFRKYFQGNDLYFQLA